VWLESLFFELGEFDKTFHYGTRGTGGMTHNDPD
jgi:hypothetical protein